MFRLSIVLIFTSQRTLSVAGADRRNARRSSSKVFVILV